VGLLVGVLVGLLVGALDDAVAGQHGSLQHSAGHGNPIESRGLGHGIGNPLGPGVASPGQLQPTGQFWMRTNWRSGVMSVTGTRFAESHVLIPNWAREAMVVATSAHPPVIASGRNGLAIVI
jgi:hypothetical protein